MAVINIRKAEREGARLVVGFQGISGSGKTLTALLVAYGMANGDGNKVGFLDTENRRGSLYASQDTYDKVAQSLGLQSVGPFLIGDLNPPFSPARYVEAIREFEKAGVEVLVIDSVSHEWAGQGGCYDIAKNTTKRIDDWLTAKNEHKRFMSAMLQSPMHIICCIREAPKTDFSDPKNPKSLGLMPIQESQFVFELTASLQMFGEGKHQNVLKCPEELRGILGRQEGYITAADGKALRDWVDGAKQLDPAVERYRHRLQSAAEQGLAHIQDCWNKTPGPVKQALGDKFRDSLFSAAQAFDDSRTDPTQKSMDDINAQVMGDTTQNA